MKNRKRRDSDLTTSTDNGYDFAGNDVELIDGYAKNDPVNIMPQDILKHQMHSVLSRLEAYIQDQDLYKRKVYTVEFFVSDFCKVLGLTKTQFAACIDIDISNLNKYLKGQRTLNTELAMKLAYFFNTPIDIWLKLQLKNDLILVRKQASLLGKYDKYDYKKVLGIS